MPTRSFIGLIILIALLVVASVPQLLDPTAAAVERTGVKFGLLPKPPKGSSARTAESPPPGKLAGSRLALKGHLLETDGDLRDTVEAGERGANRRGRLVQGSARNLLPGQRERDVMPPPASSEDGVLLDATGCPVFRAGTDVEAMLADPAVAARYRTKAATSDDPAACGPLLDQRITEATTNPTAPAFGPANARDRAAIQRGDTTAMIVALSEIDLLAELMAEDELAVRLEELRQQ